MPYNSRTDVVCLLAERYNIKSYVKLYGFQSQLQVSYVSSYTDESWYNNTVCLWMTIYIYIWWSPLIVGDNKCFTNIYIFIFQKYICIECYLILFPQAKWILKIYLSSVAYFHYVKLVTIVEGDRNVSFSIATTHMCWGALYLSLDHFTLPLVRTL